MSDAHVPHRGDIIQARTGGRTDLWAVVSNDIRNTELDSVLAARVLAVGGTSPTRVATADDDPLTGYISADHIVTIYRDEIHEHVGTLTPTTMTALSRALRAAMP
ncbi:type II toxin-antitoxin system PemK/MazF family toxin [Streptomyces sp. NPDC001156]